MRYLPVFLDLKRGPVLLVGSGEAVRAKMRLLLSAGASIRWYATDGNHTLLGVNELHLQQIQVMHGDASGADLEGVVAVLAAGAGEAGHAIAARAQAQGIPANVMDDIPNSSFIFPAIVDRGDVVVAIGTGGSSPVVARRVRESIERLLPARIGELAGMIGRWRRHIHEQVGEFSLRRRFWERVIDGEIGKLVLEGRGAEAEHVLRDIRDPAAYASNGSGIATGHVTIVGAGPGDPDLLTVKGLRALQDADVIYYDELVSPEILNRARRDATTFPVGRRVGQPGIGQDAINALLVQTAREGKRVVRLKGGDPFIFGRGGEEVQSLREAGVPYSIVPGITAALGAAAEFEVPLTYRHEALRVTFLTAHKASDAADVNWSALIDRQMTIVVYMGMAAAASVRDGLLAAGREAGTPVGVFARATRADAASAIGELYELPELVSRVNGGPALLVIGDVAARARGAQSPELSNLVERYMVAAE